MIVDTSAVVAVIKAEPGWEALDNTLAHSDAPRMSAGTYQELTIVVDQARDPALSRQLDQLLDSWGVVIEPVTADLARVARNAYRDFGRGSGHSARLNFGDCFAYALASQSGEPLLFVGADFSETDLTPA
ncbi:type II toxin-antitoxin system VapC family toxin [Williamsia sterculiae]|uniref:Ribonuclease VapC n=1 Tax=Williamsia sterculiae TaxID=1344003 RepID=A0A1N7FTK0_9NOCA|nr:type II toxin-antitoxin system VapC family toxin [Williamsia sterculiae]SIS03683.1 ribonuclease VapC [Williamsia sterculiae]